VGFVVDTSTLRQDFSKYFGRPVGQRVTNIVNGLSLTPIRETKKTPSFFVALIFYGVIYEINILLRTASVG
jgi:hypothetical protein